jgi:hypothetical protein
MEFHETHIQTLFNSLTIYHLAFKFSVIIFLGLGRLTQAETVSKNQAERIINNIKV